jgi:hypothetical protein
MAGGEEQGGAAANEIAAAGTRPIATICAKEIDRIAMLWLRQAETGSSRRQSARGC